MLFLCVSVSFEFLCVASGSHDLRIYGLKMALPLGFLMRYGWFALFGAMSYGQRGLRLYNKFREQGLDAMNSCT